MMMSELLLSIRGAVAILMPIFIGMARSRAKWEEQSQLILEAAKRHQPQQLGHMGIDLALPFKLDGSWNVDADEQRKAQALARNHITGPSIQFNAVSLTAERIWVDRSPLDMRRNYRATYAEIAQAHQLPNRGVARQLVEQELKQELGVPYPGPSTAPEDSDLGTDPISREQRALQRRWRRQDHDDFDRQWRDALPRPALTDWTPPELDCACQHIDETPLCSSEPVINTISHLCPIHH